MSVLGLEVLGHTFGPISSGVILVSLFVSAVVLGKVAMAWIAGILHALLVRHAILTLGVGALGLIGGLEALTPGGILGFVNGVLAGFGVAI